jgi:hypothetical protein
MTGTPLSQASTSQQWVDRALLLACPVQQFLCLPVNPPHPHALPAQLTLTNKQVMPKMWYGPNMLHRHPTSLHGTPHPHSIRAGYNDVIGFYGGVSALRAGDGQQQDQSRGPTSSRERISYLELANLRPFKASSSTNGANSDT